MTIMTSNIARMQLYMRLHLTQQAYGMSYKFTIDQLSREIYNEDSLPVHADTIIDRILIKTSDNGIRCRYDARTKAETIQSLNINDSIDLQ